MATINEYKKVVSHVDNYTTPPEMLGKSFFPALRFFPNMVRILLYSNRQAVKGYL